jgi:outer membrane lipoprotein SlyB
MEERMEAQEKPRLHPLMAGAAVAVIIAAGVAVAAITGYLPGSNAEMAPETKPTVPQAAAHPAPVKQHVASATPAEKQHVAAVCHDCGVIVEVKEVEVLGKGTGVGAVAGGVGGAVIGHEIGNGSRAGTAVGAVVGAVAGHQIERQAREHKKYEISVHMNDGSTKAITDESGNPVSWKSGDKVRVGTDGVIRPI